MAGGMGFQGTLSLPKRPKLIRKLYLLVGFFSINGCFFNRRKVPSGFLYITEIKFEIACWRPGPVICPPVGTARNLKRIYLHIYGHIRFICHLSASYFYSHRFTYVLRYGKNMFGVGCWFRLRGYAPWSWNCVSMVFCKSCTPKSASNGSMQQFKPPQLKWTICLKPSCLGSTLQAANIFPWSLIRRVWRWVSSSQGGIR